LQVGRLGIIGKVADTVSTLKTTVNIKFTGIS
jgi:hypothetical protein